MDLTGERCLLLHAAPEARHFWRRNDKCCMKAPLPEAKRGGLRVGAVEHAHDNDGGGVNVERQLDLLAGG